MKKEINETSCEVSTSKSDYNYEVIGTFWDADFCDEDEKLEVKYCKELNCVEVLPTFFVDDVTNPDSFFVNFLDYALAYYKSISSEYGIVCISFDTVREYMLTVTGENSDIKFKLGHVFDDVEILKNSARELDKLDVLKTECDTIDWYLSLVENLRDNVNKLHKAVENYQNLKWLIDPDGIKL